GRFDAAERRYRAALAIMRHIEKDYGLLGNIYHNLGGLEHARGRYARGEKWARRAVELSRPLGEEHPRYLADVCALGGILDGQRKFDESEPIYRRAIAAYLKQFGPTHYEVAVNLNNLAAVRAARGDAAEARALYRRCLAVKQRLFGDRHPELAVTL